MNYKLKANNWGINLNEIQQDAKLITEKRIKGYTLSMKETEIVEMARLQRCGLLAD